MFGSLFNMDALTKAQKFGSFVKAHGKEWMIVDYRVGKLAEHGTSMNLWLHKAIKIGSRYPVTIQVITEGMTEKEIEEEERIEKGSTTKARQPSKGAFAKAVVEAQVECEKQANHTEAFYERSPRSGAGAQKTELVLEVHALLRLSNGDVHIAGDLSEFGHDSKPVGVTLSSESWKRLAADAKAWS